MTPLWNDWVNQVAAKPPTALRVIIVDAETADDLDEQGLQAAADRSATPVVADKASKHHGGKVFWPRELVEADAPPGMRTLRESLTVPRTKRRVLEAPARTVSGRALRDRIKTNPS